MISFGYMYDRLEKLAVKKQNKSLTDKDCEELAKELKYMETDYIPMLRRKVGLSNSLEESNSIESWVREIKRPRSFKAIMSWLENEDYEITMKGVKLI